MARRVTRKPKHQALYEHARRVYLKDLQAIERYSNTVEGWRRTSDWHYFYLNANDFVWSIKTETMTYQTVAKLLAATSPLKRWSQNKAITKRIVEGEPVVNLQLTTERKLVVLRILTEPEYMIPETAIKTHNFYHNIINPDDRYDKHVTLDRHMLVPVVGRVSCSPLEYAAIADAIRSINRSAKCPGICSYQGWHAPSCTQAILWGWYRTDKGRKPDHL